MNKGQLLYVGGFLAAVAALVLYLLLKPKTKAGSTSQKAGAPAVRKPAWCTGAQRQLVSVKKYVGEPDYLEQEKGGLAAWNQASLQKANYCLTRLEVRDSDTNKNYVYAYLDLDLPEHQILDVRRLTDGVEYNTAAKQLVVNSRDLPSAVVVIAVVKRLLTGQLRTEDARSLVKPWILQLQHSKNKLEDLSIFNYEVCKYLNSLQLDYLNSMACTSNPLPCGLAAYQ